jgi:hypothetical protein
MSLLRRGKVWHYSFCLAGERYRGSTQETSLARARNIEALLIAKRKTGATRFCRARLRLFQNFQPVSFSGSRRVH